MKRNMKIFFSTVLLLLFLSYCSYSQVNKIVLVRVGGGEFPKSKLTITLHHKTDSDNWFRIHNPEECPLYSEREKVCGFCRHFHGRAAKKTVIIKKEKKSIQKTDFDSLVNAIESLDINELEKNNTLNLLWLFPPPTIKLELYENDVNTFSYKYVSASNYSDFPVSLLPLNTIAKDIFKLAGIKSKKYCVK